jgi:hypothetical protein
MVGAFCTSLDPLRREKVTPHILTDRSINDSRISVKTIGSGRARLRRGPAFRILEKQNHLMVNLTENGVKLDSSAIGFAFKVF